MMTRRYTEPVEVRLDVDEITPASFLWRRRIYLVGEVLGQWTQRLPWWVTEEGRRSSPMAGLPGQQEVQVWRVVAAAGRSGPAGVFELLGGGSRWWLRRVLD